ncbi:MAG: ABC transporter substrate-binding protein [Egibacteraceae bacterium]
MVTSLIAPVQSPPPGAAGAAPAPVDELTRRGLLAGGLSLAALMAGGGAAAASTATAGFPRTVQTGHGPVLIPSEPERIVTMLAEADAVVALGRTPVAMAGSYADPRMVDPWLVDRLGGAEVDLLNVNAEVPFEQIAAARPDLILAGTFYYIDEHYERLSAIAPTVTYVRGQQVDTWQDQTLLIGGALAEEEAARAAVARVESRIERIRPDFEGRTCSLSHYYEPNAIAVIAHLEDFSARLLYSLGFRFTPGIEALAGGAVESEVIGLEQLPVLDADLLLMTHASPELRREIEANPLFANLPAVAGGRYVPVALTVVTAMRTPSILRVEYVLDELVPDFAEALGL